jgi:osmotically-inducible protein OsmY
MKRRSIHSIVVASEGRGRRWILALGVVSAAVLALASVPATRAEARTELKDRDISSAIETDLLINDQVPADRIDVSTKDGIVTLRGSVYNILARDKATEIAESIKGVRSVVNEIRVKPVSRSDQEVRRDVMDALVTDPATDADRIDVKVIGGNVTLSGQVDSYGEKNLCTEVAKGVRGVREVTDNVTVAYDANRTDQSIAEEVEARFRDDVRIDAGRIDVTVKNGKVRLRGTVPSAGEKSLASTKAWVAGVKSVDDSDLKVEWFGPGDEQRESTYVSRSDEQIEQAVHDALMQDPRVSAFEVDVDSDYGVVTLAGVVDNLEASKAAEQDSRNTVGTWRVKNHLKVRPVTHLGDEAIVSSVKAALKRDPYLDRHDLRVSAYNGKIFLYGTVDSEFEKQEAEDVAYRVSGVIEVADYLDVRDVSPWESDWEIKDSVEDQLQWDPIVNAKKVNVSVDDGVATLTGKVDTWYEYTQAARDAVRGGARQVKNEIQMKHAPWM